jgi:hypothetical protein
VELAEGQLNRLDRIYQESLTHTRTCHSVADSGGQISTKHLTTSIRPFFATCHLPQYPEFWRCVEPGILFLGPHCKRSLKSLDTLLKVPMRNTQLLPRPRKMVAVVLNIFFLGVYMFFILGIQCDFWLWRLPLDRGK